MARRKPTASSGAPGLRNGPGQGTSLSPLALQRGNSFLDPTVALRDTEHPSAKWAGLELQPIKPRS